LILLKLIRSQAAVSEVQTTGGQLLIPNHAWGVGKSSEEAGGDHHHKEDRIPGYEVVVVISPLRVAVEVVVDPVCSAMNLHENSEADPLASHLWGAVQHKVCKTVVPVFHLPTVLDGVNVKDDVVDTPWTIWVVDWCIRHWRKDVVDCCHL